MRPFPTPPDTLVVHCTASPNGMPLSVDQIRAMHKAPEPKGRGFSDIGYHWVIGVDGVRRPGRPSMFTGAGVKNENSHTLHICLVGTDKFPKKAWETLAVSILQIKEEYPSIKRVCGHRDYSPDLNHNGIIEKGEWIKTCPSFDVAEWLKAGMDPIESQTIN